MRKKAIVLATACVMILVVVFFEFYVFRTEQTTLTVQAWNDASISLGSGKWYFLYEPSFGATYESHFNFPFPYFSINPSELEINGGKPILIVAWTNATSLHDSPFNEYGFLLSATKGTSRGWGVGIKMTIASADSFSVTLVFERIS